MTRRLLSVTAVVGVLLVSGFKAVAAPAPLTEEACTAAAVMFDKMTHSLPTGLTVLADSLDSRQIKLWSGPEGYDLAQTIPSPEGEAIEPQRWFLVTAAGDIDPTQLAQPARATIQALLTADLVSATGCAAVRRAAISRGVSLRAPPGQRKINRRSGLYAYTSIRLSVPVFSPDGTEALAYADSSYGPEGAGGALWLLRRGSDGAWKIAARLGLWVS